MDNVAHAYGVFAALACAASAVGTTVVTDFLVADANGVVHFQCPEGSELVLAIQLALQTIGSLYQEAHEGAKYAHAYAKGVHSVLSVVSHSDEGGFCRDLIRCGDFAPSYGALLLHKRDYVGVPIGSASISAIRSVIDSVALATAGVAAYCDRGVEVDYGRCSTVICLPEGVDVDDSGLVFSKILPTLQVYLADWSKGLAEIFSISSTDVSSGDTAAAWFAAAARRSWTNNSHLAHKILFPYYWVEPTHIVKLPLSKLPNNDVLKLRHCNVGERVSVQLWPSSVVTGNYTFAYTVVSPFTNARSIPALQFLSASTRDGLAKVFVQSADINMVFATGLGGDVDESVAFKDALDRRAGLNEFLWGRGHTDALHPGEFSNRGAAMRFMVQTFSGDFEQVNAFTAAEVASGHCEVIYHQPGCNASNLSSTKACPTLCNNRSRAARALTEAVSATKEVAEMMSAFTEVSYTGARGFLQHEHFTNLAQLDIQETGTPATVGEDSILEVEFNQTVGTGRFRPAARVSAGGLLSRTGMSGRGLTSVLAPGSTDTPNTVVDTTEQVEDGDGGAGSASASVADV